jgi:hypothetical protein
MKRMMKRLFLIAIFAVITSPLQAGTPEEVVEEYINHIKEQGLPGVSFFFHPDEVMSFHATLKPLIEESLKDPDESQLFIPFRSNSDTTELVPIPPREFMDLFMGWMSEMNPGIEEAIRQSTIEVVGHVPEGELNHVVVRLTTTTEGTSVKQMQVYTTRDHKGEPLLMLTGNMQSIIRAMESQ